MSFAIQPEIIILKQQVKIERLEQALSLSNQFINHQTDKHNSICQILLAVTGYANITEDAGLIKLIHSLMAREGILKDG